MFMATFFAWAQQGPPNTQVPCTDYRTGGVFDPANTIAYWNWQDGITLTSGGNAAYRFWQLVNQNRSQQVNASPFYSLGDQPNTRAFFALPIEKDFKVEDGWELSCKFFGETLPNQSDNYTNNPPAPSFISSRTN